nr:uncharacterized protein LOC124221575 [Neodiprion pinetum]
MSSGKRYDIASESSSDEDYRRRRYKHSYSSNEKFDDYDEDNCKTLKKANRSSSSLDVTMRGGRSHSKRPCMNKNAQAARENRIRKKKHLEQVENKLSFYQQKSKSLVNVIQKQDIDIKKLKGEVTYLRCLLKNKTNITALLQSMNEGLSKASINRDSKSGREMSLGSKSTLEQLAANANCTPGKNQRLLQGITKRQLSTNDVLSNSELDHTYTIPTTQRVVSPKSNHGDISGDENHENIESCNGSIFGDDILLGFEKQASLTSPLSNLDELIDVDVSNTDASGWSSLSGNVYDNFTNFDEILNNTSNNVDTLTNLYDDSNILEEFKDAGICLHVNSKKVSLEFCSICHMNSLNSMSE